MTTPSIECNFEDVLDADSVFDAIISNSAVPDEIKKRLFFL